MINSAYPQADSSDLLSGIKRAVALVFLRDWHPVLRDPLDLFRLSFPVGALIYALMGNWDAAVRLPRPAWPCSSSAQSTSPARSTGFSRRDVLPGLGQRAASVQPFLVVRQPRPHHAADEPCPDPLHRIRSPGCRARPVRACRQQLGARRHGADHLCLGVTAASFYEIYEWVVDHWFGQHLFIGETDTVTDLADGFLGAGVGGLFLAVWAIAKYTTRRLPTRVEHRVLAER